jgi:hypothetical protein
MYSIKFEYTVYQHTHNNNYVTELKFLLFLEV